MSREILQKYHIRAKKSLGQNFLVDETILEKIALSLDIIWKDILEVGPGYGALTEKLLEKNPSSLHLVELDRAMIDILEERFIDERPVSWDRSPDLKIFQQDILQFTPSFQAYYVIANIPYYITSPILRHFLYDIKNTPEKMLILMQKDVADKILWGKKKKSWVLSLFIDKKCHVSEKLFVPKESFIPAPKIESSVLLFEIHELYREIDDTEFLKFIKIGFSEPRKKLIKNLVKGGYNGQKVSAFLTSKWYDENFRGEDGGIEFWIELFQILGI